MGQELVKGNTETEEKECSICGDNDVENLILTNGELRCDECFMGLYVDGGLAECPSCSIVVYEEDIILGRCPNCNMKIDLRSVVVEVQWD